MARNDEAPEPEQQEAGPTDVTIEEALAELSTINGESAQQLAIARVKIRKQSEFIRQLQSELAKKAPANAEGS